MIAFNENDIVYELKQLVKNHLLLTQFYPVRFLKWPLSLGTPSNLLIFFVKYGVNSYAAVILLYCYTGWL